MRVPMRKGPGDSWIAEDEVAASIASLPPVGQRFSMDVSEELLARMGRECIPHIAQKLSERVVFEHRAAIHNTVLDYLNDREWAAPIIEEEIRRAVGRFVFDMLAAPKFTDAEGGGRQ